MLPSILLSILYPIAGVIAMGFAYRYLGKRSPSLAKDFLMLPVCCGIIVLALTLLFWPVYILGFLALHRHHPDPPVPPTAPPSRDAQESASSHLGAEGHAHTDLTPAGLIDLDGKIHEALSIDGFIPAGTAIRVVEQDSLALKVETIPEKS